MKNVKGIAVTEKGALKPLVRNKIKSLDLNAVAELLADYGFTIVEGKNAVALERKDENDNSIYTVLTMTISTLNPTAKAERVYKSKAKPTETIEIE